ncbi:CrcB-like protein-domain-containing protein [Chlamydoabsidia padenii]|nr:CrcB-like protein-domain-containing protein [Chlamydoabsidia padenii]
MDTACRQNSQQDTNTLGGTKGMSHESPTITVYEKKVVVGFIIIPFAMAGALVRVGLQRLETYNGAPVFGLVYAQWIGCFIMGMVTLHKNNLFLLYHPLQVGLASGLCGSITSFSSWQYGMFGAFANVDGADHTRGKNVLAGISQCLVTLAMSFSGYHGGQHIGRLLDHLDLFTPLLQRRLMMDQHTRNQLYKEKTGDDTTYALVPHVIPGTDFNVVDRLIIAFGLLSWIGVILAAVFTIDDQQRELALTCVFAPVGALLRWYLSFFNGKLRRDIFVGTLSANLFGTLVLGVIYLLRFHGHLSLISCIVLSALADGFCGCLTTISTFVVELSNLPLNESYLYGLLSIVLGQCLMFVMVGCYIWTHTVNLTC